MFRLFRVRSLLSLVLLLCTPILAGALTDPRPQSWIVDQAGVLDPDTLGHRAAIDRAERALAKLADEVTMGDTAARLARVARARVLGEPFMIAGRAPRERR